MKLFLKNNWLFLSILLIQLIVLIFSFAFFKEGYHSDEFYEYGYANSYESRVLEVDNNGNDLSHQWTDSDNLLNYISVDKDHRFSYKNILVHASNGYYNPPLRLFVLHTICSFFPGVFSKWFSFIINIVSFIVIQIYLYLLLNIITKRKAVAIAGIFLFGFGAGCFNAMMFLRLYVMGMAFGMILLYYSYLLFINEEKEKNILYLVLVFLSLFGGAYTLHLFLVYAFPIVLIICIGYLFRKKFIKMLCYGFTCLGAVGLSFLAFPKTVSDTMQSTDSYGYSMLKYSDAFQFRIYTYIATLDNFGFHTSMYSNPWIKNSLAIFIFLLILSVPLIILFRKETWFRGLLSKLKDRIKFIINKIGYNIVILIACIVSVFFLIIIVSNRTSVYTMSVNYASRYVYLVYPLICIFTVLVAYYLLSFLFNNKKIVSLILVIFAIIISTYSQMLNNQPFLMLHDEKGISLDKIENDANCYLLLRSNWFVLCFADELYDTNSYYFAEYINYQYSRDCFDEIDHDKPLYIIADASIIITDEMRKMMEEDPDNIYNTVYSNVLVEEEDVLNFFTSLKDVKSVECVGEDWVFERDIRIYRVTFS